MSENVSNIDLLAAAIEQTNQYFLGQMQRQVNVSLTLRNWLIGYYIVEYEQHGEDRATYGNKILETLASRLKQNGIKGMAETNLKLFRQFFNTYPQIRQTASDESEHIDLHSTLTVFPGEACATIFLVSFTKSTHSVFLSLVPSGHNNYLLDVNTNSFDEEVWD